MFRFGGALCLAVLMYGLVGPARAADEKAKVIIDKAAQALGGEEKLTAAKNFTWKAKGKINIMGNESDFTLEGAAQGLDRYRGQFEGDFGGNKVKGVTVLNGDKAWRKFADNNMELEKDGVANEKRTLYLLTAPITLAPLRDPNFKVEVAGEEKVGDKAAAVLKVTGPDGKDCKIYFDKESGLPIKLVAKVIGFMGEEFTQENTYADYKDMGGIKKATKLETKRDGEKFMEQEIADFKTVDKLDAKTFDQPD